MKAPKGTVVVHRVLTFALDGYTKYYFSLGCSVQRWSPETVSGPGCTTATTTHTVLSRTPRWPLVPGGARAARTRAPHPEFVRAERDYPTRRAGARVKNALADTAHGSERTAPELTGTTRLRAVRQRRAATAGPAARLSPATSDAWAPRSRTTRPQPVLGVVGSAGCGSGRCMCKSSYTYIKMASWPGRCGRRKREGRDWDGINGRH